MNEEEFALFLEELEKIIEKSAQYSLSISMHHVPFERVPENYIRDAVANPDGSTFGYAKSSEKQNHITLFYV